MRWFPKPLLFGALLGCALGGCVSNDGSGRGGQASYGWEDGGGGCTLTRGYWRNHEEAWPVDSLTMGGEVYTKAECLELLSLPTEGDVSISLSAQLIATLLNLYGTAPMPAALADVLAQAQDWLVANKDADGRLPFGVHQDHTGAYDEGVAILEALTTFNEGDGGVAHCDDQPDPDPDSDPESDVD